MQHNLSPLGKPIVNIYSAIESALLASAGSSKIEPPVQSTERLLRKLTLARYQLEYGFLRTYTNGSFSAVRSPGGGRDGTTQDSC